MKVFKLSLVYFLSLLLFSSLFVLSSLAEQDGELERLTTESLSDVSDVRIKAYRRLDELGPLARLAKQTIIDGVSSEEKEIQLLAIRTLGKLGLADESIVTALCKAISNTDPEISLEAVRSIGRLGENAKDSVSCLITALDSEDKGILLATIFALGQLGDHSKQAVPKLIEISQKQEDWLISSFVFDALSLMPGQDQLGAIREALKSKDDSIHQAAFSALISSGDSWSVFVAYCQRYSRNIAYIIGSILLFLGGFFTARFVQR